MATVAVVGLGHVGVATTYSLALKGGGISKLILVDHNEDVARGHALDLQHGLPFIADNLAVEAVALEEVSSADVIVITAGKKGKPGQSRLELLDDNKAIINTILPPLAKQNPKAVFVLVINPVDVLTYYAWTISGLPRQQVLGSGTILDTARFRQQISETIGIAPTSIHAYILGEHGDSSVPIWSSAQVGSKPLENFLQITPEKKEEIATLVRTAAGRIIALKGYTDLAIGVCAATLVETIVSDSRRVHPVSCVVEGEYGCKDVAFGVPAVIGRTGIHEILEVPINETERKGLQKSAEILKGYCG